MSQFNEGREGVLRSVQEHKQLVERNRKIIRPYYFGTIGVCGITFVLYSLNYIDSRVFSTIMV